MKNVFTPVNVMRLLGITYRQIQYWDNSKFISPSYRRGGRYRLYTLMDVFRMYLAWELNKQGVSIQKMRRIDKELMRWVPTIPSPLSHLSVLVNVDTEKLLICDGNVVGESNLRRINACELFQKVDKTFEDRDVEQLLEVNAS